MSSTKLATNAQPFVITILPTLGPNGGRQHSVGAARAHDGGRAPRSTINPAVGHNPSSSGEPVVIITVTPAAYGKRGQLFSASVDGRTIVTASTIPLLDGARTLAAEGHDPATVLVLRHAGSATDALRSTSQTEEAALPPAHDTLVSPEGSYLGGGA